MQGELLGRGGRKSSRSKTRCVWIVRQAKFWRRSSILDHNATEERAPPQDQSFPRSAQNVGGRLASFVTVAAENALTLIDNDPAIGNGELDAAEESFNFDDGFFTFDFGRAEVDFDTAEDGFDAAALEIADVDAALDTTEEGKLVEHFLAGGRGVGGAKAAQFEAAGNHQDAANDEEHGPEGVPGKIENAEMIELEIGADEDQDHAADAIVFDEKFRKAEGDENQRPKLPQAAEMDDIHVVEEEERADGDEDEAGNNASGHAAAAHLGFHTLLDARVDVFANFIFKTQCGVSRRQAI